MPDDSASFVSSNFLGSGAIDADVTIKTREENIPMIEFRLGIGFSLDKKLGFINEITEQMSKTSENMNIRIEIVFMGNSKKGLCK
ncbi:hypothetical protein GCM10009007_03190 [Formosimonas limnophila]|uniref:Uncharacterized protein n=1 Tax=Formosimonas limnophila TaxID=1384487 RepID=A0A8J3FXM8_9BURK|nr:hypothetical protein GCM10009007_03190 [Formosimonas limnophila]